MERAGTTGVDAAVPMVESSARLACDGEEEDDDNKSWYDTYNMTGDGEKKEEEEEEREAKERERERGKRYTYRYSLTS